VVLVDHAAEHSPALHRRVKKEGSEASEAGWSEGTSLAMRETSIQTQELFSFDTLRLGDQPPCPARK
jgi:hypothetical protein